MSVNILQASVSSNSAAQNVTLLKQVWSTIQPDSCPTRYNFHLHTIYSDGQLKPEALIQQAVKIGLKGLAITDHHSAQGYQVAQSWLDNACQQTDSEFLPHLWTGAEIDAQLLEITVHILGYAFDPEHPVLQPYLQGNDSRDLEVGAKTVIDAIHTAGGLAVLAHPARYQNKRQVEDLIPAAAELGIDGVETYYGYNRPNPWQPSPKQTERVQKLSAKYGLFDTCGTDTHGKNILICM
ncbi:MAG: PHP domain-containing protein [Oscillatoria sp. PMC 1051.18]|nr:PHP domain-containing protein [Oscillatoria sp. PMC 1050.18]MEC5030504.1 PHP domain-containing protein [Oscillatoria sp. PMC 1051.18]